MIIFNNIRSKTILYLYRGSDQPQLVELWCQTHDPCLQEREEKLKMVCQQRKQEYYVTRAKNSPGGVVSSAFSLPLTPGSSMGKQRVQSSLLKHVDLMRKWGQMKNTTHLFWGVEGKFKHICKDQFLSEVARWSRKILYLFSNPEK